METDISDADRVAGNTQVLAEVESEIASLERMFTELASLGTEKDRLTTTVENLTADETRTLQDDAAESVIVKKLIEIRARRDVQSTRLVSVENRIREQTANLSIQGEAVRRAFQAVVGRLWLSRDERITAALRELFSSDWIILRDGKRTGIKDLVRHTQLMKEVRDLDIKVSHPIGDPAQEWAALQHRPRIWLTEVTDLVTTEPRLVLTVSAKRQPIEQPREMAAV